MRYALRQRSQYLSTLTRPFGCVLFCLFFFNFKDLIESWQTLESVSASKRPFVFHYFYLFSSNVRLN